MANFYINTDGYNLTVYGVKTGRVQVWKVRVVNRRNNESKDGLRSFDCAEKAKLAAFDALIWAKENL